MAGVPAERDSREHAAGAVCEVVGAARRGQAAGGEFMVERKDENDISTDDEEDTV